MLGTLIKCSILLLAGRICWGYVQQRRRRQGVPLPPGPRRLPFIGNLFDIPSKEEWLGYQALTRQYGMSCFEQRATRLLKLKDHPKGTSSTWSRLANPWSSSVRTVPPSNSLRNAARMCQIGRRPR
jgi:hypothetical protein